MTEREFLEIFKDIIMTDATIAMNTPLKDIDEWDSMAIMAIIAYFDVHFKVQLAFDTFKTMFTIHDVYACVPQDA